MNLHKQSLVFSIEALLGEHNVFPKKTWLTKSLVLSKLKIFYKLKSHNSELDFDISHYINTATKSKTLYIFLTLEILYLLNFKKKFSQRNMNRLVDNYFTIIFSSIRKRLNTLTIPRYLIEDQDYLTTLALSNLYTISQFYYDEQEH